MFDNILKFFKTNALFIAMLTGIVFHNFIIWMLPVTPYLLFFMLLITYCRVSPRQMKPEPLHLWLSCVQLAGCLLAYFILKPFNSDLAEGCMLCILAPTATSAPAFASLLGGGVACLATYSILSNLSVAFLAPSIFSILGAHGVSTGADLTFVQAFLTICTKVIPLLLGPFILAVILKAVVPKVHSQLQSKQIYSFWLWVIALAVLMAGTTSKLIKMIENDHTIYLHVVLIALGAAVVCAIQFFIGWLLGQKYNNKIAGGQGLGQKNTILAIWMANTFFNPLVAIAPASYVLWQNLLNSYQLWKHQKELNKSLVSSAYES